MDERNFAVIASLREFALSAKVIGDPVKRLCTITRMKKGMSLSGATMSSGGANSDSGGRTGSVVHDSRQMIQYDSQKPVGNRLQ